MSAPAASAGSALITGASGGIGLELARLFARDHHDLVLVARSKDRLREIAAELSAAHGITARVLAADLSDPAAPAQVARTLEDEGVTVDALVNNAGYAMYGPFVDLDADEERRMMQVNMVALTALTRLLLPGMLARRSGRILNLASTASFQPGPLMAVYYASKAYVLSFSEALAEEVRGSGVTVTALCPGPTRSGFQARAQMEESRLVQGEIMDAATVARIGYDAMHRGRAVVIPGARNLLLAESLRVTPRALVRRIVRRMQERATH